MGKVLCISQRSVESRISGSVSRGSSGYEPNLWGKEQGRISSSKRRFLLHFQSVSRRQPHLAVLLPRDGVAVCCHTRNVEATGLFDNIPCCKRPPYLPCAIGHYQLTNTTFTTHITKISSSSIQNSKIYPHWRQIQSWKRNFHLVANWEDDRERTHPFISCEPMRL